MVNRKLDRMTWNELYVEISQKLKLTKDKEFKKFFMEREKLGYLFDYFSVLQAYIIYKKLRNDYDSWTCFSGYEGEGKSQFSMQFCSWVDPTFNVERIHFEIKTFFKALKNTKPGQAFLLDEGGAMAFSRSAMSLDNKLIIKIAQTVRAKNLLVAICCPNFHFIDSYLRYHRIRHLFHIKERGKYKGVIDKGIMTVLVEGSRYKNIAGVRIHPKFVWDGYFSKVLPPNIDEEVYTKKKNKYINVFLDEIDEIVENGERIKKEKEKDKKNIDYHNIQKFIPLTKVAKELGISITNIYSRLQEGSVQGKKIGKRWLITMDSYNKLIDVNQNQCFREDIRIKTGKYNRKVKKK